jgi:nucleotide-binding universal stress UspA family protein
MAAAARRDEAVQQTTTREDSMSITIQARRPPAMHVRAQRPSTGTPATRPVIAAVDGAAAGRTAAAEAIASARALAAPLLLVHVRRGPSAIWGRPFYQRRLERSFRKAREALAAAAEQARTAGVEVQTEILEGRPARQIAELARARDSQLVIVGPRRRRAGTSVFRGLAAAGLPVVRAGAA